MTSVSETVSKIIKRWWIPISFVLFYTVGNGLIYVFYQFSYPSGNLVTFLTCWFNPSENWIVSGKKTFGIEVFLNFIFVAFILFLATVYSFIQPGYTKKYATIGSIYLCGIGATYITSGLEWYFSGQSGSGTSILAFSFDLTFNVMLAFDVFNIKPILRFKRREGSFKLVLIWIVVAALFVIMLSVSYVEVLDYISEKYYVHFIGLGVYTMLLFAVVLDRLLITHSKKHQQM